MDALKLSPVPGSPRPIASIKMKARPRGQSGPSVPSPVPSDGPQIEGDALSGPSSPAEVPLPRGKSYEDLEGASGREVLFRPQRYSISELGPVLPVVLIATPDGGPHQCVMHDISQNGVAFEWPDGVPTTIGMMIPELVVRFDDYEAHRGQARVSSLRDVDGKVIAGAAFLDTLMNIEDVLHMRDVKSWRTRFALGLRAAERSWYTAGHDRFKSLVAEYRLFLEDSSAHFGELEGKLPWHVVHGETPGTAHSALIERIQTEFAPECIRYMTEIDGVLRQAASESDWEHLKLFSQRFLQPFLMRAPILHRCCTKPLGYPGDFEVMRYIYDRPFEGQTLFGKAIHLANVMAPASAAVRARKDLVKGLVKKLIASWPDRERTIRIASIAAGPAQEIFELLSEMEGPPPKMHIVLFEQDKVALGYAYSRLSGLVESRWKPHIRITYLHDSIKRLLHDSAMFTGLGPFDLIFCTGLFDYLRTRMARTLCRNFHDNLKPQGRAYVGNMVQNNPCRWIMEHHLEWYLIYRTREELLDLGNTAAPDAKSRVIDEPTGINPFLELQRQ